MKVVVNRLLKSDQSMISTFEQNNKIKYYAMEPPVPIPAGTYPLIPYKSPTHGIVAMLGGSMAKRFILIHIGNYPTDTRNCLLVGSGYMAKDFISGSKAAFDEFTPAFLKAFGNGEKCTITYIDAYKGLKGPLFFY